jgi:hypothetical protein
VGIPQKGDRSRRSPERRLASGVWREGAPQRRSQAVIHNIHSEVGSTVSGPDDSQRAHAQEQVTPAPPGHFLSDQLESDCARFLEDVRLLVRRREQDLARAGARL